jgi:hypothetical protein
MPTYNPKDMAYVLQMSKTGGKYTPDELALMQGVNQAMGGGMANMPTQAAPMQQAMPQSMPQGQQMQGAMSNADMMAMQKQAQPMNRLAQIQAAANQVLAGGENPEGQRMANIAKYFQGRQ